MKRRVVIQRLALEDLDSAYSWVVKHAPDTASRWLRRFNDALHTLESNAERCGRAPENRKVNVDLRQLLVGARPNVFRAIYVIEGECVRVLRILRAQRRHLTKKHITEALEPDEP